MSTKPALIVVAWLVATGAGYLAWQRATERPDTETLVADARAAWAASDGDGEGSGLASRPAFRDVTEELGMLSIHDADMTAACRLPEPFGPGIGLFDFNGDDRLDIFVTGGGALPPDESSQRCQLWFQDATGRFREVAAEVGADVPGPAYGVACGDYDADGDEDLFVTRLGDDVLLRNDGGRFVDVTRSAGIGGSSAFGCSATFFDYDRDGYLDLYVSQYVDWSPVRERECVIKGRRDYCSPTVYEAPTADRLFHNLGDGRFEDVTDSAGIAGHVGNGLGVIALDFDTDGWEDLYVANDVSPAFLWHNQTDGTFAEVALERGAAYNGAGVAISGMGVVSEDLDGDGRPDLVVANIADQSHLALMSRGKGYYDGSARVGIVSWSRPPTAFGLVLFDQDLDGELDLYVGNGLVQLGETAEGSQLMAEDDQFARLVDGRFLDVTKGSGALTGRAARAVARGDLDGDGDEDLVLSATGDIVSILRNERSGDHHWLALDIVNSKGGYAIGASVEAVVAGKTYRRRVRGQESYLSSSSPRIHLGLGDAVHVEKLIVTWVNGEQVDVTGTVKVDGVMEVRHDG